MKIRYRDTNGHSETIPLFGYFAHLRRGEGEVHGWMLGKRVSWEGDAYAG